MKEPGLSTATPASDVLGAFFESVVCRAVRVKAHLDGVHSTNQDGLPRRHTLKLEPRARYAPRQHRRRRLRLAGSRRQLEKCGNGVPCVGLQQEPWWASNQPSSLSLHHGSRVAIFFHLLSAVCSPPEGDTSADERTWRLPLVLRGAARAGVLVDSVACF